MYGMLFRCTDSRPINPHTKPCRVDAIFGRSAERTHKKDDIFVLIYSVNSPFLSLSLRLLLCMIYVRYQQVSVYVLQQYCGVVSHTHR